MAPPAAPVRTAWMRRLRRPALAAAGLVALVAAVAFLAVPPLARSKIEDFASAELGRRATLGKIAFNPFTLSARISDFALASREPGRTLLRFEALELDVSTESLWRRAPVLDGVRLVRPRIEIARDADGRYDVQDLVDAAMAPSTGPEAVFAVTNIEIEDGTVVLDDAVHARKIVVTKLGIGIPFLSSFARDSRVRVQPRLQGEIDGAPFALAGTSTSPFEELQRATLAINLDALPLPRYMEYAPLPGGLKLSDGALTTRLSLAFLSYKGSPRGVSLSGNARVERPTLNRRDGSVLAAATSIEMALGSLDPLRRTIAVDRLAVAAPEVDVRRLKDGTLEIQHLIGAPPGESPQNATSPKPGDAAPSAPERTAPAWAWSLGEMRVSGGTVRFADAAVNPAFRTQLSQVTLAGAKLANTGAPGTLEMAFDAEEGAHFAARSEVDMAGKAARGHFAVTKLPLAKLHPYFARLVQVDIRRGALDFAADFDAGVDPAVRFAVAKGTTLLADLDVALRGERQPLWHMARANADGIALDLGKRSLTIDSLEARQGALRLVRDASGVLDVQRALAPTGPGDETAHDVRDKSEGEGWHVIVRRLLVERFRADFEDRIADPGVKLQVADASIKAENLDTARGARASVDLAARIGAKGRVRARGSLVPSPLAADLRLDATALDLAALRPYVESGTNIVVTSGELAAKGRILFTEEGPAGPQARYAGDVAVSDFASLDRPGSQDLLRWKSFSLNGADVTTAPLNLAVNTVALDGFYARLILNADATLNLQRLLAREPPAQATSLPPEEAREPAAASAPATERHDVPASIGRLVLSNGDVEYSDFFVKPNYSVRLTDVTGEVSSLSAAQAGTVALSARVDRTAPVEIRGTLNPFARELALDITGKATDVDLPPLTPYSTKYAGYGIQKGKLSMEVRYRLENRKLAAENRIVLDQLTFGEHVDSPTATRLPVLLAVSLLKDRNGVINLDLPIAGTLDDPQFSIWRVVVQIIVNLLAKAATAPFALLGAAIGGAGEQLAYVEFAPGSAVLTPAAQAKLATLAKALADRPGLKLDAAGRAIPEADREGLKRAALDRALRIEKQKALAKEGKPAPAPEELAIDAADHAKYLKAAYANADLPGKPRNFIGMAKDIPAAQMEELLLAGYRADDEALRELANRRAQAVKQWFAVEGKVAVERLFIVAPRLDAEGIKGGGAPTRVDFAIR